MQLIYFKSLRHPKNLALNFQLEKLFIKHLKKMAELEKKLQGIEKEKILNARKIEKMIQIKQKQQHMG